MFHRTVRPRRRESIRPMSTVHPVVFMPEWRRRALAAQVANGLVAVTDTTGWTAL